MITLRIEGADGASEIVTATVREVSNAREYALASTAKLVREHAKYAALIYESPTYGLGWPENSPFTGTINNAKGSKREAFTWARKEIDALGRSAAKDTYINKSAFGAKDIGVSRVRQAAIKRLLREGKRKARKNLRKSTKENPMQRLGGFVRSKLDAATGRVLIGFFGRPGDTSPDSRLEELVDKNARGFTTTITARMRRFLFAIGVPVRAGQLRTPPRPWFSRVFANLERKIPYHFETKFLTRLADLAQKRQAAA